jgi:hypothetical protein
MHDWIQAQKESGHHRTAVTLFPMMLFLGYFHPIISGIGLFVFFLVTSFKLLKTMLIYMLILGVISALIPPLAPIILIIMIVLFIMRIGFVIKNWRPFVAGILIYGSAGAVIAKTSMDPYSWLSYNFTFSVFLEAFIVSLIAFFALRATLISLYRLKYNSSSALGIMGSAPLIIISFILPFLKLHVGGEFFAHDTTFTEGKVMTSGDHVVPKHHTIVTSNTDTVLPPSETAVNGTQLQHVKAHVRTAPDGDPTNNLSYHGPDAKPPNTANLVQVNDYVRTAPDGDITNNLSYQSSHTDLQGPKFAHSNSSAPTDHLKPDVQTTSIMLDEVAASIEPGPLTQENKNKVMKITSTRAVGQNAVDRLMEKLKHNDEA